MSLRIYRLFDICSRRLKAVCSILCDRRRSLILLMLYGSLRARKALFRLLLDYRVTVTRLCSSYWDRIIFLILNTCGLVSVPGGSYGCCGIDPTARFITNTIFSFSVIRTIRINVRAIWYVIRKCFISQSDPLSRELSSIDPTGDAL